MNGEKWMAAGSVMLYLGFALVLLVFVVLPILFLGCAAVGS
jgi:hypothetical protein